MVNRTNFEPINLDDFKHDPINQEKVQSYPPELVGRFNSFIVTAFDDSMTVEMQIRTMIKWVKENIDVTMSALDNMEAFKQDSMAFQNHVKDTLVNLINQFTDTFDDNLQFEMQEILKQWDEEGYLQSLINEHTNERVDKVEEDTRFLIANKVDKNGSGQVDWDNLTPNVQDKVSGLIPSGTLSESDVKELHLARGSVSYPKLSNELAKQTINNGLDGKIRQDSLFTTHSKNLFNKKTVTTGLLQFINGIESVNTTSNLYFHSDFIPVKPNTRYFSYTLFGIDGGSEGNEYDKGFKLVRQIEAENPKNLKGFFVTGPDTYYIRINGPYSLLGKYCVIETEVEPNVWDDYGYGTIEGLLLNGSQLTHKIHASNLPTNEPINLFDKSTAKTGGLANGLPSTNENLLYSDFIRVNEGDVIRFNKMYHNLGFYYGFNKVSKGVFGSFDITTYNDDGDGWYSITIPNDTYWIAVQTGKDFIDKFMVINTDKKPKRYLPYGYFPSVVTDNTALNLNGDNVLIIGDSISWLDGTQDPDRNNGEKVIGWQQKLVELGATLTNMAVSGDTARKYVEGISNMQHGSQYDRLVEANYNLSNINKVVFVIGRNDAGRGLNLGTIDGKDPNFTLDAISLMIHYIMSKNKEIQIYICSPLFGNSAIESAYTLSEKLKELAHYFKLPFYDLHNESGINQFNYDTYLYDNVHPNNKGMALMGTKIAQFLISK